MSPRKPLRTSQLCTHFDQAWVRLSNRLPVRVEFAPVAGDYPMHDHEFYEICIVTHGRALHLTQEGKEWIQRGSVIVVAPGQTHGFAKAEQFGILNVYYLAEWFLADLQALRDIDRLVPLFFQRSLFPQRDPGSVIHFPMGADELRRCLHDFRDLEKESLLPDPQPLYLESSLLKCLVRMARAYTGSQEIPSRPVLHAQRQLERDVALGITPNFKRIAQEAGVSYSHFCRLFKTETGMSAGTYFQRTRIHRACHRLLTTSSTLTEIALLLGYADSAHFSRFFKAIKGLTPREYRTKFASTT